MNTCTSFFNMRYAIPVVPVTSNIAVSFASLACGSMLIGRGNSDSRKTDEKGLEHCWFFLSAGKRGEQQRCRPIISIQNVWRVLAYVLDCARRSGVGWVGGWVWLCGWGYGQHHYQTRRWWRDQVASDVTTPHYPLRCVFTRVQWWGIPPHHHPIPPHPDSQAKN